MKRTIPYFTVILLAALNSSNAFAQAKKASVKTPIKKPTIEKTKKSSVVEETIPELIVRRTVGEPAKTIIPERNIAPVTAPDKLPELKPAISANDLIKPEVKRSEVLVNSAELSQIEGLELVFNENEILVTGSLPLACAPHVSIQKTSEEEAEIEDKDEKIKDLSSLDKHTKKIGIRLSFKGTPDQKTLGDCIKDNKEFLDKSDLSLTKKVIETDDLAVAGFLDSSGKVVINKSSPKSKNYKEILALFNKDKKQKKLCVACDIKEMQKALSLNVLIDATLEAKLVDLDAMIKGAKDLKSLEAARSALSAYADFIADSNMESEQKEALIVAISKKFDDLFNQTQTLAFSDNPKKVSKYADFIASTYGSLSSLPYMSGDSRREVIQLKADFSVGGSKRVNFLSAVDPANDEVRSVLNGGQSSLARLSRDVQRNCWMITSQNALARCNAAKQNYNNTYHQLQTLAQRFIESQRMIPNAQPRSVLPGQTVPSREFVVGSNSGLSNGLPGSVFPNANQFNQPFAAGSELSQNSGSMLYNQNVNPLQMNSNQSLTHLYQNRTNPTAGAVNQSNAKPMAVAVPLNLGYSVQNESMVQNMGTQSIDQGSVEFHPTFTFSSERS